MRTISSILGLSLLACSVALAAACTVKTTEISGPPSDAGKSDAKASNDKDATKTASGDICEQVCEASASADCKNASKCVANCEAQRDQVPAKCKDKADDSLACAAKATSFKCSSAGNAVVDGECETEGQALLDCLSNGGTPDGGDCGGKFFADTQCETCRKTSCCAESAACDSNEDCIAILDCISQNQCADDACFTECENQNSAGKADELAFYGCLADKCTSECQ